MDTIDKAQIALDNLFNTISEEEFKKIVNSIDKRNLTGPTVEEYFDFFENNYVDFFKFKNTKFKRPNKLFKEKNYCINENQVNILKEKQNYQIDKSFELLNKLSKEKIKQNNKVKLDLNYKYIEPIDLNIENKSFNNQTILLSSAV